MSYDDVRKQLMQATYQKNTGSQATQEKSAASTPAPARSSGYDEVYAQLESSLGSDARLRDARNRAGQASGVQTPAAKWQADRGALIKELNDIDTYSGWIADVDQADQAEKRRREIIAQLEQGDLAAGIAPESYSEAERGRQIFRGATGQSLSGYLNFVGTGLDFLKESAIRLGGNADPYAGYATDEFSAEQIGYKKASEEDYADTTQWVDKLQSSADRLGESANAELQKAKSGLGKFGQAGVDIAANVLQMGYDAALGGLPSMFVRSAGSAAQEARQQGANVFQQAAYGTVVGGVEVLTEKMFDGVAKIYGAGAADDVVEELIRKLTKSDFGRTALRWFAGAAGEGIEEVVSDLVAPYAETIYNGKSIGDVAKGTFTGDTYDLSEILYDFVIGAAIGGLGGATNIATGQDAQANRELLERDAGMGDVTSQANDAWEVLTGRRTAEQQAERESAARERLGITAEDVAARNAETQAENLTAEPTEEQKKQNRTETMRGILSRSSEAAGVQMTDEEATAIAEGYEAGTNGRLYAAAATDAYKLGKSGQYSLEEAMKASQYTARISADQFRRAFETGAGAEAVETNAVDAGTEEGKQTLTAALSSLGEHAEDAASAYEAGQDVSRFAAGMSEAAERFAVTGSDIRAQEGGIPAESVISTLTDAQIEKAQEIGGRLRETRAAAVSQLAEQRKAIRAQAQAIEQQGVADAAALTEVNRQIREANKIGRETVEMFEAQRDALTKAVEADPDFQNTEEYAKAFDEAKENMERAVELQKSVEELQARKKEIEGKAPAKRKKGTVSLDGGNIAGTDYAGIDRSKLTRQQQNIVAMVERLADFINIDYVVFDGPANMGGAYMQGGRLYININAGMTQEGRKSIAAASLSHELTHFMQEYAPEEYQQLKDYVIGTILNKSQTEFDRMIRQQRRWEPSKSYDELADELVANACQTMLTDDKAVQRMARSNMTLAQKVADVLDEIGEKIRKAFEGLSFDEDRAIFAPVKAVMDEIDGITDRWADGISAAVENYNAEQTVRNSVPVEEVLQDDKPKFQMTEDVEATDKLVAVHNKSVSGLRRMLQRGGVPFPSIAIKKAGSSHEGFGEVSIVFPRSTIDPAASRWNRLYSNDAWTPTEPRTEYDVGDTWKLQQQMEKEIGSSIYRATKLGSYLEKNQLERDLSVSEGDIVKALKGRTGIKYAYLKSIGQEPEATQREKPLDGFGRYENAKLLAVFDSVPDAELKAMGYDSTETLQKVADALNQQWLSTLPPETAKRLAGKRPLYSADKINPQIIKDALRNYENNGRKMESEVDDTELERQLRDNKTLEEDPKYQAWIRERFDGLIKDSGIPNGKGVYTDTGNRRSFKARHVPATLENIVQQMRKEQEKGIGLGGINLRGAATKAYRNVEEMRAESGKLLGARVFDDEYDSYMKEFGQRLNDLTETADKVGYDTAKQTLLEAVRDSKSRSDMQRRLQNESRWINYSDELADDLWQLRNDVQNMPAPYFEAKPRRVVSPDEALAYIIPDNAGDDIVADLESRGYNVMTYKAGNEQDRLDKLNSVEGARFQVFDDASDDTASESRGRDIAYARLQSENAILSETVAAMKKITSKQDKTIAALQKRLQVTTTPEVRQSDARKLARQLIRENGSKADAERVSEQLKALGDYILQTETDKLSEDEIKNRARSIARDIVESASEQISIDDGTYSEIADNIKGRKLSIDEAFLGELNQAGGYDRFRKSLFGRLTIAKRESNSRESREDYTSVDQFYTDMQNTYGKAFFPDVANEGEQVQILAQMLDAGQPMEVNPYEQYMGEATEDMANRIVMDAMNGVLRQTAPTTADRQKARTQALKEQIDQLKAENKLEQREAASLYHTVYDLTVALDKAASKYQTLRTEANYRAAQLRAEGTARAAEIKAAERERAAKQITALKEHYRDMQERARERRGNTATRGKIRKLIADLNQRLVHPNEFKHVPKELTRATIDLLEMIDDPRAYRTEKGALDAAARIADIRQVYESYKSNPDFPGVYDEAISEMLDTLAQNVRGTTLRDMNETQLQAVYRALQAMTHVVNDAVKVKIGNEERNAFQMAREMTKETREVPKAQKGWLREHGIPAHLRADVAFDRFGGFKKNSTWQQAARLLNDGQLKQTHLKMQLSKPFANLFNNQKALSEFTGMNALGKVDAKKLVDVGLKDENGNAIPITRDFMVALYMDLLNEDNRRHFIRGGKKVPDFQAFYDGKGGYKIGAKSAVGIAAQLSKAYHELEQAKAEGRAENGGRYVRSVFEGTEIGERVNKAEAKIAELESEGEKYADEVKAKIESLMTDYDRAWVEATKQLMDVDSKRELNKTTMEVYGIEKARVDNYFPIFTDEDFVSTQMETVTKDASLENAGFMKERVESGNPTHAVGMVWAVTHQIDRVAQYCGLMPAIRNFGKVYSKAEPGYTDSLKNALSSTFGEAGTDYVENLIADLQGARKGEHDELGIDKMLGGLRGNLARSTLTLNPRVALAQAASFPTAAAELGYGPIMKALAHGGKNGKVISRADQELIAKWSPLLWYRMQGYATPELGDIQSSNRFGDRVWRKARYVTGWIQAVDGATVGRLWYAAEYWVQEHKADLEKGSDAYYEAVAEKFNDVVEKTQPNYTTMQRAAILRNPNSLVKTFTMFMTQRLQNFNILYDAAGRYQKARADFANNRNGVTKADVSEARANVTRAVTSQIAAQAMFVGIKVAVDFLLHSIKRYRDDETGDITAESTSLAILDAFCDALVGTVVFGSELYEIAKAATGHGKWYGLSISGVDTIGDLIESMVNLTNGTYDLEDEKSRKTLYNRTMKLAANIAQALGYPLNNALKMGQAVYYHIVDAANGEFGSFEAGYDRTTTQNANKIILALETGDDAAVQAATEAFEIEKDALSAVRAQIKKQYEAGDRTAEEAVSLLEKAGMDGNDAWFAVNSWETGDSSRYTAVKRAALSGDKAAFQQAMTVLTAHGVKQKEVYSQIKTFVKNAYFGNELSEADTEILGGKKLSDADTRTLLAKYCGLTADEAVELVASWEETKSFVAAHGSEYERYGLTVPQAKYYYEQVKGAASLSSYAVHVEKYGLDTVKAYYGDGETSWRETGLTIDHYNTYRTGYSECKGVDRNGDGKADPYTKQEQVLQLIDSLPVSDEVKDALYLKNGYSRRNIGSAPWRRRG